MTGTRRWLTFSNVLAAAFVILAHPTSAAASDDLGLPNPESGTWLSLKSTGISSDLTLRDPAFTPGSEPWQRLAHARVTSTRNVWLGGNQTNPTSVDAAMRGTATLAAPLPEGATVGMRFGFGHREAGHCVLDSSFEVTKTAAAGEVVTELTGEVAREAVSRDCSAVEAFDPATGRIYDALSGTLMFWEGAPGVASPSTSGVLPVTAYSHLAQRSDDLPAAVQPWAKITQADLVVVGEQLQARVQTGAPVPSGQALQLRVGIGTWFNGHCLPRAWADYQMVGGSGTQVLAVNDVHRRTDWTCAVAKTSDRNTPTQPYDEVSGLLVHRADNAGRAAASLVGSPVLRKGKWTTVRVAVRDVNDGADTIKVSASGKDLQAAGTAVSAPTGGEVTLRVRATKAGKQALTLKLADGDATFTQTVKVNVR